MASFKHPNFHIDQKVDKIITKNFEKAVRHQMEKMATSTQDMDEEDIRNMAISEVLIRKEKYKLKQKTKAAQEKKEQQEEQSNETKFGVQKKNKKKAPNLLKRLLMKKLRAKGRKLKQKKN